MIIINNNIMFENYENYEKNKEYTITKNDSLYSQLNINEFNQDTITFKIITNELEFDNNEKKSIVIFNHSSDKLCVLISELSDDDFKYKELENTKILQVCILKENEYVYICKEKYFSVLSLNEHLSEFIQITLDDDNKNDYEQLFNTNEFVLMDKQINCIEDYELILYDTLSSNIKDLCKDLDYGKYKINLLLDNPYDNDLLKMKYSEPLIQSIMELKRGEISETNMFFNNKLIQKLYAVDVCYWILNECFKHNFVESIYEGFGKVLNINQMPHILDYVLYSSDLWVTYFKKLFNITEYDLKINISEIFIANNSEKYNIIKNPLDKKNFFVCKILLNDKIDFKGGNTNINGNSIEIKQCDMLIYNINQMIKYEDITHGMAYYMVFILDIDF